MDTAPLIPGTDAPADLEPARVLQGRYFVLGRLGEGGMGVVYSAYDRTLDRRVALKVIHAKLLATGDSVARLLREARAMARLKHPNVVTVYDVGLAGDQAFVTMELVDGQSLRAWLAVGARSWREVVPVFLAAGRGLAAAHDSGLVHRDFKPDNVLVGRDGTVRVADFGLARLASALEEELPPTPDYPSNTQPVTRSGAVIGTPRYMSPEQRNAEAADARSDQYSFCVTLHEALHGEHPFPMDAGEQPRAARRADVPGWLRQVVARGLSRDPDRRFPSMSALLVELGREPALRRRRILIALGSVAAIGGLVAWGVDARIERAHRCDASARRPAGLWDDDVRGRVRAAFAATGAPYADAVFASVATRLDRYAGELAVVGRAVCEATELRHEQPRAIAAAMTQCLDERREELAAASRLLLHADKTIVQNAVNAASALGSVDACGDPRAAGRVPAAPADPGLAERVWIARKRLTEARLLHKSGKVKDAHAAVRALEEETRALGFRPVEAQALVALAEYEVEAGNAKDAVALGFRAYVTAVAARDDDQATRAAITLVTSMGLSDVRREEAKRWGDVAAALLDRVGGHPILEVRLELALGQVRLEDGDADGALAHYQRALTVLLRQNPPDRDMLGAIYNEMGGARRLRGAHAEALGYYTRAYDTMTAELGAQHPRALVTLVNVGSMQLELGRLDEAVDTLHRAVTMMETSVGREHLQTLTARFNLAGAALEANRLDEAEAQWTAVRTALEAKLGRDHPMVIRCRRGLATVASKRGEHAAARAELTAVLGLQEQQLGKDHPDQVLTLLLLGRDAAADGKPRDAAAYLQRALALSDRTQGKDHPENAEVRAALASLPAR